VDRFMMKILVGYPSADEEFVIVERVTGAPAMVASIANPEQLSTLQRECREVYVDPSLIRYAVRLVAATRNPASAGLGELGRYLLYGASPRATIHLIEGGRALAYLRGRDYMLPEDVYDLAPDVLRHRLVLSYDALAESLTTDQILDRLLRRIPLPEKPMASHVAVAARP
jgi:MoxR-like ATPase